MIQPQLVTRSGAPDLAGVTTLLCDADGTLFGSEEPAYAASAEVTNRFLAELGAERPLSPSELQQLSNGKNFRGAAADYAVLYGKTLDPGDLEDWVTEEKDVVTAHLRDVLRPDRRVTEAIARLSERFQLAVVTSSALSRVDACLEVTALAKFFPPARRFSAEDTVPLPASKPDPAVYRWAGQALGISSIEGLAVEDSVNGTLSAVGAGFRTVGTVQFIDSSDREDRTRELIGADALTVVGGWSELVTLLAGRRADRS